MGKKDFGKNFYNDIGLRFAQKVFGLEYLHYGYFTEGMAHDLATLPKAQEAYVEKVLSKIPGDTKKVLDIGCGAGGVAKKLTDRGLEVMCVDPDPYMIQKTREATNNKISSINAFYEVAEGIPQNQFDLVLMSESCQYIPPGDGFRQHAGALKKGGHVLIADFFKVLPLDKPYLSKSGHDLEPFLAEAKAKGFELVEKIDITKETAPTMDIYQRLLLDKAFPVAEAVIEYVQRRAPWLYKLLNWFAGEKVRFLKTKYEHQGADIFAHYKQYLILLFKKV